MRRSIPIVCAATIAACGGANEAGTAAAGATAAEPSRSKTETKRGKLAPPPASMTLGQFWPSRICTRGPEVILVTTNCGCDSRMTCSVARRAGGLDLHIGASQELCNDCGVFATSCAVPADVRPHGHAPKTIRLTLDGKPVLDALELPPNDAPVIDRCYE
jgi:hypothetical protein